MLLCYAACMEKDLIQIDPNIMVGNPVVRGTRLTVELIAGKLAAGISVAEILDGHPRLTREGIEAARQYAAQGHCLGPCANPALAQKRR